MVNKPELLEWHDDGAINQGAINQEFLLAYERSILLSLQEQGILNQQQYEECVKMLKYE